MNKLQTNKILSVLLNIDNKITKLEKKLDALTSEKLVELPKEIEEVQSIINSLENNEKVEEVEEIKVDKKRENGTDLIKDKEVKTAEEIKGKNKKVKDEAKKENNSKKSTNRG